MGGSAPPNRRAARRRAGRLGRFARGVSAAHGRPCVLRRPSSCHHALQEEHRCHPGPCPPCRQACLLPLPGCSHACPQPCHDQVLVRSQQVRRPPGAELLRPCPGWRSRVVLVLLSGSSAKHRPASCFLFVGAARWAVGAAVSTSVCDESSALSAVSSRHSNVGRMASLQSDSCTLATELHAH